MRVCEITVGCVQCPTLKVTDAKGNRVRACVDCANKVTADLVTIMRASEWELSW